MEMETTFQNLSDETKAVLSGSCYKSIMKAYLKKQEKSQLNNLTLHLKELEKEEQTMPKVSRRREINIRVEILKIDQKNQSKKWFFKKISYIGLPWWHRVENLPANAGDTGSSPGLGRSHMPRSN